MVAQPNNIISMDEYGEVKPAPVKNLAAKMARVMTEIERLPKAGKNTRFDYTYATEGDILETIRPLMAKQGIAFFPTILNIEETEKKTSSGNSTTYTRVFMQFDLVCGDTGETKTCHWVGDALDNQDKGINKAVTAAEKYFILKTFMMSTGDLKDDPDSGIDGSKKKKDAQQDQRQNTSKSSPQSPPTNAGQNQDVEPVWYDDPAKIDALLNIWQKEGLTSADVLRLAKVEKGDWSAYPTGKSASEAIKAALEAEMKSLPPASTVEQPEPPVDTTLDDHFGKREATGNAQPETPELHTFNQLTISTFQKDGLDEYKLTFHTKPDANGKVIKASTFHYGKYQAMGLFTREQLMAKETILLTGVKGQIERSKDGKFWNIVDGTVRQDLDF